MKLILLSVLYFSFFLQSCTSVPKDVPAAKPAVAVKPKAASRVSKLARKSFLGMFPRSKNLADQLSSVSKGFEQAPFLIGTGPYELPAPNGDFVIAFEKVKEANSPLKRYSVFLKPQFGDIKQIGEVIGWVAISPDSKFVAREPLTLINVKSGEAMDLAQELGLDGFVNIHFWAANGKSLIVSQTECAFHCPANDIIQYWRIDLL